MKMHRITGRRALLRQGLALLLLSPLAGRAQERKSARKPSSGSAGGSGISAAGTDPQPPALEPVVAALEPISLRTELARAMPEAKRTVIVPAREDAVLGLTHYSKEEFAAAGLDWEQFMARASAAATRLLVSIKPVVARDAQGEIAYIRLRSDRPFTASIVYSPRLVPLFKGFLGERLVALIPDRHTVFLFSRNFGGFRAFGQKIINEHADAVYPCSIEAFEITQDGVKCIGGFDDGAGELPQAATEAAGHSEGAKPKPELPRSQTAPARSGSTEVPRRIPAAGGSPKK